jgi:hypothetical protein
MGCRAAYHASMTPSSQLRNLINGYQVTQAIHVAAVLRLSDLLAEGPRRLDDLAAEAKCEAATLHRLVRALATIGLYEELADGRVACTELGDALRTDAPESVRGWAVFVGRQAYWSAWTGLEHSVRTGENAFAAVHGRNVWDYRADHLDESAYFDDAMTALVRVTVAAVLEAYDFSRFTTVIDVGGGRGALLAAVLRRNPTLTGVLFDQPHVVAGAAELLATAEVSSRCRVVGGSFFDQVPAGGDAYMLKSIVHDWADDDALAILRKCRQAMADNATLLLFERVVGPATPSAAWSDLNMLVGPGGRERTETEYATLLAAADLRLTRVVATASDVSVVEALPA